MKRQQEIFERLARAESRFLCLDPTGARVTDPPARLEPFLDRLYAVDSPLDLFPTDARSQVVTAFGLAKANGSSSIDATLRTGERMNLTLWDETSSIGCFVAILSPLAGADPGAIERSTQQLPVRYTHYKLDLAGVIVAIDPDLERLLGWTRDEMVGRPALEFIHPDDHEKGILGWISLLEDGLGGQCRMRQRFEMKSGGWIWLEDTNTNYLDDPEREYVDCQLVDVTDEMAALHEAERRDALLTKLTHALPSGVLHLDASSQPAFWNQRWLDLLGTSDPSLKHLLEVCERPELVASALNDALETGRDGDLDVTLTAPSATEFGRLHFRPLEHGDGSTEVLITFDDTTNARTYQAKLLNQARRDPLTGLLSRFGLRDIVNDLIETRGDGPRALLFVDLDRFKPINDRFGHAVGDQVLRSVGHALTRAVRAGDAVARIGGDEFVVAVHAQSLDEVEAVRSRIDEAVRSAEDDFDFDISVSASIGAALVEDEDHFDSLLQRADAAMYRHKREQQRA